MGSLISRSIVAQAQLERTNQANQVRNQVSAIQARQTEWSNAKRPLIAAKTKLKWFTLDAEAVKATSDAIDAVKHLSSKAKEVLVNGVDIDDVSKDGLWLRMVKQASSSTDVLREEMRKAWRASIEATAELPEPESIRILMMASPANQAALRAYSERFQRYRTLRKSSEPSSQDDLKDLRDCEKELKRRYSEFVLDLPPAVRRFQQELPIGAPLELLTPEVLAWLKENDDLSRFVVRTKAT